MPRVGLGWDDGRLFWVPDPNNHDLCVAEVPESALKALAEAKKALMEQEKLVWSFWQRKQDV